MRILKPKALCCSYSAILRIALLFNFIITAYSSCGDPPRLLYAEPKPEFLSQQNFPKDSVVQYNCRPGYMRVPGAKNSITCLDDTWSDIPKAFCSRRPCPTPPDVDNGYFEAEDFLFGSTLYYFCNAGYIMMAKKHYRECKADGTWSNAIPECEAVLCMPPYFISNGIYEPQKDEYTYLDAVRYTCNGYLALKGESSIFCTENGTWSSEAPTCTAVDCPDPKVPNAIRLSGFVGPYTLDSAVTFKCKRGFKIYGAMSSICKINSQWEPPLPECEEISCGNPGQPENGNFYANNFKVDSIAWYSCNQGYIMTTTPHFRVCRENGTWSDNVPQCKVKCPEPRIRNMRIFGGKHPYVLDSLVSFQCNSGFTLNGSNFSTCSRNGQWDPPLPECLRDECPTPEIRNGHIKDKNKIEPAFYPGDTVTAECDMGYVLNGSHTITCLSNSEWSPLVPTCVPRVSCPEPVVVNGGIKEGTPREFRSRTEIGYEVNTSVKVKCKFWYSMEGEDTIFCRHDLKWYPKVPTCKSLNDCSYPDIQNGKIILLNGKDYNPQLIGHRFRKESVIHVQCDPGFIMSGSSNSTCTWGLIENYWSPELPVCASE
ncbi:zona pellucida sperm-binding protein 3 receptor-like isoform 2-T2 [Discoglossus pictus]